MKTKTKIFIAFLLNLVFSIFELIGGIITGSFAITSDAVHDFGDAVSIGISYALEGLSHKKPNDKYTYGYARFSVLGGLLTSIILLVGSGIVVYNAIWRIIAPKTIDYNGMTIFAIIGLIVNFFAAYFTHGGKSINQKAVNLHMLEDVLGWAVVLIGALVMRFTNLSVIDPILSVSVALFIVVNCIKNLAQITQIFLIKTPKEVSINELRKHIKEIESIIDVHHIHIWSIDGETHCATLHIVAEKIAPSIKAKIKEELQEHGVTHVTIEMETPSEECHDTSCNINRTLNHHSHNHHCN